MANVALFFFVSYFLFFPVFVDFWPQDLTCCGTWPEDLWPECAES